MTNDYLNKILVIQTAFIGDAVLTLPMIQELKKNNPDYLIDVLAIPTTAEIFSASPFVNEVIVLDKKGKEKSIFSLIKFVKEIKKKNYSKIYSPHRSARTSFIVMQSGVNETYGFDISSLRHVYKHLIEYKPDQHEVQRNLKLIGNNSDDWKIRPHIEISQRTKEKVDIFLEKTISEKIIAVAPGSIWNTKRYPRDYYIEIIKYFVNDYSFILIGGKNEESLCEEIARQFENKVINSAGFFSLTETVELLRRCRLLISNDSAPAHLAAAANTPVLMLYCSTVPGFGFYPYMDGSVYLSYDDLSCKPCGIHGYNECPLKHFLCGRNLKPEKVIQKVNMMVQ